MNIVVQYDSSAANAPAGFATAVQAAVSYYDNLITTPITVTIKFSYGEIQGQALSAGDLGESESAGSSLTYGQLVAALASHATSATDLTSVLTLPAASPVGAGFWATNAEAKALGLSSLPGFGAAIDGYVGLNSAYSYSFDPSNRAVSGEYDAVGVLEHEISEVLGRIESLGTVIGGKASYAPLDLFRYSAPGVRVLTQASGSFSIDGGQTLLQTFNNPATGGDAGDWASSVVGDSYGSGRAGVAGQVSATDLQVLDVLGYTLSSSPTTTPAVSLTAAQFTAETAVLGDIVASFDLTVTGVSAANRATVEAASHVVAVTISDTATDLVAALGVLNADTEVGSIVVSNNAPVIVTAAQQSADAHALGEMVNANGTAAVVQLASPANLFSGTAAQIVADLATLANNSALTTITITDNAPVILTASEYNGEAALLGKLVDANGGAYSVSIHDTAAQITQRLDSLKPAGHTASIVITDNAPLQLGAAQTARDASTLALMVDANGQAAAVAVTDTAANIASAIASGLGSVGAISSVSVADSGVIALNGLDYAADTQLLAKLSGARTLQVTGVVGQSYSGETLVYNSSGTLASQTTYGGGTTTVTGLVGGVSIASAAGVETVSVTGGGDSFVFNPTYGHETITGFLVASDTLTFSHTLFINAAAALAATAADGQGGSLIHAGTLSIDLVGVTPAQLQQNSGLFHFI